MEWWESAIGAGGAIIGGVTQAVENKKAREWQSEENEKARRENFYYNELAAMNADMRQRSQYKDYYSPEAYMQQLKTAGLSPSLVGGAPPSGGTATGQQGGGTNGVGANTPNYASASMAMIGGAQVASQIELNKAAANEANARAREINGETPFALANIAKTWADAGNKEAATRLTNFQSDFQRMLNSIKSATSDAEIEQIISNSRKAEYESIRAYEEARSAGYKANVDEATMNEQIKQAQEQTKLLVAQVAKTEAEKTYLENYIETWAKDIAVKADTNRIYEKSVQAQQDWYAEQRNMFTEKLKQDKELATMGFDVTKQGQWINAVSHFATGVSQALILGAFKTPTIIQNKKEYDGLQKDKPYEKDYGAPSHMNIPN